MTYSYTIRLVEIMNSLNALNVYKNDMLCVLYEQFWYKKIQLWIFDSGQCYQNKTLRTIFFQLVMMAVIYYLGLYYVKLRLLVLLQSLQLQR